MGRLDCQSGTWAKQASGYISVASKLGLPPSGWPDWFKCDYGEVYRLHSTGSDGFGPYVNYYDGAVGFYARFNTSTGVWREGSCGSKAMSEHISEGRSSLR